MVVMHFSEVVRVVFLFINPLFFEVVVVYVFLVCVYDDRDNLYYLYVLCC